MKIETKSLLIGVVVGILGCCTILYFLGNIETEFSFTMGKGNDTINSNRHVNTKDTIISYNIRYDNKWDKENLWTLRKHRLSKLLMDYDPSIFGIQEGLLNQVKWIDSTLEKHNYIGVGRDDGMVRGEFCAIYFDTTQYEVLESSTFWLSDTPDQVSVGWDAALERICTYGLFKNRKIDEKIWVFNAHFDHVGTKARKRSSELILNKIEELNNQFFPVVLMGDFNSNPDSDPIKIFKNSLQDALEISSTELRGPMGTFNGFDNSHPLDNRIDYIFVKNMNIFSYRHIDDRLKNNRHISDHFPVMITVQKK